MFTYVYLYLFFYILTYFFIIYYLVGIFNLYNSQNKQLSVIFNSLKFYNNINPLFFLFFLLTGLPPVGFFIIKFNIIITALNNSSFIWQLIIFINLLINMFFYLQVFNSLNWSNIFTVNTHKNLKLNTILKKNKLNKTSNLFNFYYYMIFFLFTNLFFIFYFLDFFVIFSNFIS